MHQYAQKYTCLSCDRPSRWPDICPNCTHRFHGRQHPLERTLIPAASACAECGHPELNTLRLVHQRNTMYPGKDPLRAAAWASLQSTRPDLFRILCENCLSTSHRSPGRPSELTREQRAEKMRQHKIVDRMRSKERMLELFPGTCVECDAPTTRILYIGETGKGPQRYEKARRRLIQDAEYRAEFAPYCAAHGPKPYFLRAKLGEVPKPRHWKQAID